MGKFPKLHLTFNCQATQDYLAPLDQLKCALPLDISPSRVKYSPSLDTGAMRCSRYDEGFVRGIILGPRSWTNLVNTPCYNSTTDSGQVTSAKHQYLPDFEIHFPFLIFICLKTCNTLLSCQGGKDVLVSFFCSKSFD